MLGTATLETPPPFALLRNAGPVALFVDFDGTLIDIAATPEMIRVSPDLPRRLERLSLALDGRVALVSGRSLDDLAQYLGAGIALARAGTHGLERVRADGSQLGDVPVPVADAVRMEMEQFAASEAGVQCESKRHGIALHYRGAPEYAAACDAFARQLAAGHGLKVKVGKCVVEVVPQGADKGAAVHAFMQEPAFRGSLPIFIGDDVTDEDGYRAAMAFGGFGIVVGRRRDTCAAYCLETPAEVHEWLKL